MKLLLLSSEPYLDYFGAPTSLKYYFYFDLTREIGPDNKAIPTSIRFSHHGETSDAPIAKTGFIKIGEKISPLVIGNSDSQLVTNSSVTTTTTSANTGSANANAIMNAKGGFVDFTKVQQPGGTNTQTRTSVSTHTHKEQSGMFLLKREDEQAILEGKPFSIRLYLGSYPLTFSFNEENSKRLKSFLLVRPGAEKKD